MDRQVSPFRKSWLPTIKLIAIGIVVTAVGVPVLKAGYSGANPLLLIFGGCAVIAGPMMVLMAPFLGRGGYGACPVCASQIEALTGNARDLLCGGCGTYLDVRGDELSTISEDRVGEAPTYAAPTPWPEIRNVVSSTLAFSASDYVANVVSDAVMKDKGTHVMDAHWPDGCCVCSAPVDHRETYKFKATMAGNIRDSKAELVVPDVPYCGRHKDGIDFANVTFNSRGHDGQFALRFRSLAYRDAFRALNPWRWEGMTAAPAARATSAHQADGATVDDRVVVECPHCRQQLRLPAGRSGTVKCRGCSQSFGATT